MDKTQMTQGIEMFLKGAGIDLTNEHFQKTPARVTKAFAETFLSGYEMNIQSILETTFTENKYDQMVVISNIPFCSMCAHHLLPFYGHAKIGYLPDGKVCGLSKLARALEVHSRRLQIQEKLTQDLAEDLMKYLKPKGVGIILEAVHLCMTERGVMKSGSLTKTSCLLGAFRDDASTRQEFLSF